MIPSKPYILKKKKLNIAIDRNRNFILLKTKTDIYLRNQTNTD